MAEQKWDLVFNNWNDRKKTIYIVRMVLICSIIISSFLAVFGLLTKSEIRFFALGYSIFFITLLILFFFIKNQSILFTYLGSIVLAFPAWMFWQQNPHTIAFVSVFLIVTAVVLTKFRFTTLIFSFISIYV